MGVGPRWQAGACWRPRHRFFPPYLHAGYCKLVRRNFDWFSLQGCRRDRLNAPTAHRGNPISTG